MTAISLEPLDLAALLCSRVCHDVISPVGAIVNALEVLEEDDPSMRDFALDLIKKSARSASARLQFARLAFGAAGSAGAMIDLGDAGNVANGFLNDEKLSLDWEAPRALLPKNQVKLLLNLLVLAARRPCRAAASWSRAPPSRASRAASSSPRPARMRAFPPMSRSFSPAARRPARSTPMRSSRSMPAWSRAPPA
jgi:histidine phosphotransferase ChpT